jgi:hypothetical protein
MTAGMPYYPPLAEAAHITGWVQVRIKVERGKIVQAEVVQSEAKDRDSRVRKEITPWLCNSTLGYLKTWSFDSGIDTSFLVKFTYKIAGSETDEPTTPKIEVLPSLDVNITARPIKPVVEY